ncbi:MAG: DUF1573 domain-containing protein [Salibacteraceae bacterium]
MNEQTKNYLLLGVAGLTVLNTILIFTQDNGSGRTIETSASQNALVESQPDRNNSDAQNLNLQDQMQQQIQQEQNAEPPKPAGPPTELAFAQMDHDFGTIQQNSENKHIFKFTNTGDNPLIIQSAKGSCGCTVPKYPKEPVAPGATGEIEVVYKPGTQKGNQTKTVTLVANTEPAQTILKINAMVEEVEG